MGKYQICDWITEGKHHDGVVAQSWLGDRRKIEKASFEGRIATECWLLRGHALALGSIWNNEELSKP